MAKRVIIVGGGVAGLSAAHELCERGFQVTVYERWGVPGGKARSTWVAKPDDWPEGLMPPLLGLGRQPSADPQHRDELPGEHGFRFFPGFYRHLPATMARIPAAGGKSVLDNLMTAERVMTTSAGTRPVLYPQTEPRSLADLRALFLALMESGQQLDDAEMTFLLDRFWQIATSCAERRLAEYEKLTWWRFLNADAFSPAYQQIIDISRLTVAADPRIAESRTMGDIALQMFNLGFSPVPRDRVLNGPTNPAWIEPWVDYLKSRRVEFNFNATATAILCAEGRIQSITVHQNGQDRPVSGDYYLFCVPVEAMAQLLAQDVTHGSDGPVYSNVLAADPSLATIIELATSVEWMNGIQYYLNVDVPITPGHVMFMDTPWALTAISQRQFWPKFNFAGRFDGRVQGILSVDISDWNTPGCFNKKPARICTIQEIAEEAWAQMKWSLNGPGREILSDAQLLAYHVDTDISHHSDPTPENQNAEPLLINRADTWALRPGAFTLIPNLFLAADYVRTNTMLATMEAANEAARRATNAILAAEGRSDYCKVWELQEPLLLAPWRLYDRWRYGRGLPWHASPPWYISAAAWVLFRLHDLWRLIHGIGTRKKAPARPAPR